MFSCTLIPLCIIFFFLFSLPSFLLFHLYSLSHLHHLPFFTFPSLFPFHPSIFPTILSSPLFSPLFPSLFPSFSPLSPLCATCPEHHKLDRAFGKQLHHPRNCLYKGREGGREGRKSDRKKKGRKRREVK